jgi:hypothetical protein
LRWWPSCSTNAAVAPLTYYNNYLGQHLTHQYTISLSHPPETRIGGVGNKKVTSKRDCQYKYQTGWRGMYFLPMTKGVRNVANNKKVHCQYQRLPMITGVSNVASPSCAERLLQIVLTTRVVQDGGMVSSVCRCLLIIYRGTCVLLCGVNLISVVEP